MCNNIKCKYCNNIDNTKIVKRGFSGSGKQRYKCKECNKIFSIGEDNRIKHSIEERKICIMNYLNGMSMRGIQKVLSTIFNKKIHFRNIEHWIKNADKILKEDIEERQNNIKSKNIKILEMDELYTYIKKNPKIILENNILIKEYGLLLIGMKVE